MSASSIIKLFCLLAFCHAITEATDDKLIDDDKIVGGKPQDAHSVKYMANVKVNGGLMCGATLITIRYAVTAGHCYYSSENTLTVTVGDVTLEKFELSEQVYRVKQQIRHERYDPNTLENDIMLVELDGYVTLNENVDTILPSVSPPEIGTGCMVYGWGYTDVSGPVSNQLQGINLSVIPNSDCQIFYGSVVQPTNICLGLVGVKGRDACSGDSGGPAVCNGVLDGIVSFGVGCGDGKYPGVYTRVSEYTDWLAEHMATVRYH